MTKNPDIKRLVSVRELEVASYLYDDPNANRKFIAAELLLSTKTINAHIRNILRKLNVDSIAEMLTKFTFEELELNTQIQVEDIRLHPTIYLGLIRRYQVRVAELNRQLAAIRLLESEEPRFLVTKERKLTDA